jgi:protein-tyrosine phosphatase
VDADEVTRWSDGAIDLIVDGGPCRFARASTTVKMNVVDGVVRPEVLRAGVYDERYVEKLARWTMLLVCSGNTCRSPMAEGLARQLLAERLGLGMDALEEAGYIVESAGTFAAEAAPATPEAVEALSRCGVDLSGHRSRPITPEMVRDADAIYCMTQSHLATVLEMVPSAEDRAFLLDPSGDIADPFGAEMSGYQRCAELIRRQLASRIGALKL